MSNETDFESRRDELIAEIAAAFDGVSREDGTTLHEAEAIDDRKSDEECRAARRLDTEQRWQDVPDKDIWACCSALSFLNAKGFRYYLPAFMVYGLRHFEDDPNGILHSCEFHLLHEPQKSLRKSEPGSIANKYDFTEEQCRVIAKFLRFVAGDDMTVKDLPTLQAVEKWEKYVQERVSGNGGI
jgi:hypothetical protein